jgi:hypothetical protein
VENLWSLNTWKLWCQLWTSLSLMHNYRAWMERPLHLVVACHCLIWEEIRTTWHLILPTGSNKAANKGMNPSVTLKETVRHFDMKDDHSITLRVAVSTIWSDWNKKMRTEIIGIQLWTLWSHMNTFSRTLFQHIVSRKSSLTSTSFSYNVTTTYIQTPEHRDRI